VLQYLRIAVTALSLTACVLLTALWVRSYSWTDTFTVSQRFSVTTFRGELTVSIVGDNAGYSNIPFIYSNQRLSENFHYDWSDDVQPLWNVFFARGESLPEVYFVVLKLYALVAIQFIVALVASPWLPWSRRFSLRTLLIATTLVAVGLALVVVST
jgi:hypothetical protein